MRSLVQLLFNFVVNAFWQICLIALVALLADRLARSITRVRHFVWVAALIAAVLLPSLSLVAGWRPLAAFAGRQPQPRVETFAELRAPLAASDSAEVAAPPRRLQIGQTAAIVLLIIVTGLVLFRLAQLARSLNRVRQLRRDALDFNPPAPLPELIERCRRIFGVSRVRLVRSRCLKSAATIGIISPLVILPDHLIADTDADALAAAVGHEFVHLMRRDYLLNLIYELILVPVSFHPAAVWISRRIRQTRELRCDELVAERLLHPKVYARSLVRLAGSALPLSRRSQTIIVGIADADILEVRIMSLLNRTKTNLRRNVLLASAAALVFALPCVAAAALAIDFEVIQPGNNAQEPSQPEKTKIRTRTGREQIEQEMNERAEREDRELKERIDKETDATVKAELQETLRRRQEERAKIATGLIVNGQQYKVMTNEDGQRREVEERHRTELAKAARITMDQAIQIATSSTPGKVLECSLVGELWSEPGALAKPGRVLYHVVILSGDDAEPVTNHVLVNAIDGTVVKTERELRRRQNPETRTGYGVERNDGSGEAQSGKMLSSPRPDYPLLAMKAGATGTVAVEVTIDETGNVIAAHAISGHPLLQSSAVAAARQATFQPTIKNGQPVKVTKVIMFEFSEK